jgi:hypothetical protein
MAPVERGVDAGTPNHHAGYPLFEMLEGVVIPLYSSIDGEHKVGEILNQVIHVLVLEWEST